MEQIQIGDQTIRFDREKTERAYLGVQIGDAERCGCAGCLNFAAQRKSAYPEDFRSLLKRLGVDPEKEGEAYECGPEKNGLYVYGGWFYLAGEIIAAGERLVEDPATGFQYWFREANALPKTHADFGESVIAIEFVTRIPW